MSEITGGGPGKGNSSLASRATQITACCVASFHYLLWSFSLFAYSRATALSVDLEFVMHVVCPAVGDVEHLIGSSEGGLSVPALDIKQPTPVGDRSPTSARSGNNKGEKRNSAGKRGELVCCGSGSYCRTVCFQR